MEWDNLKKYKYFNPYNEYKGYDMCITECYELVPNTYEYENVTIKNCADIGETRLLFKKVNLIVALDLIMCYLGLESILADKVIECIFFNDKKIYDKSQLETWGEHPVSEEKIKFISTFGLFCESLLEEENLIKIKHRKTDNFEGGVKKSEYRTFYCLLFYKTTDDRDENFFLRKTLDKYKIKY